MLETKRMSDPPGAGPQPKRADLLLVGGGLANSLIALLLRQTRPDLSFLLLERGPTIGGNHTWSFHETDIAPVDRPFVHSLGGTAWPHQEVHFPSHRRTIETGYRSLSSEDVHRAMMAAFPERIRFDCDVADIAPNRVTLRDGTTIEAGAVIDGRGARESRSLDIRFQKFVGIEYEFDAPHAVAQPMIMDATVDQHDGYRFVYLLPFSDRRLLVEDTYYSDGAEFDDKVLTRRIEAYATARNLVAGRTVRRERGVLPIALGGDIEAFWREAPHDVTQVGLRAALFHPTTGYSFPDALRIARLICERGSPEPAKLAALVRRRSIKTWNDRGFFRLLNRMLFNAAKDDERRSVLERFYTLPKPVIDRFYAGTLTSADKARILSGRPPVPISRAITQLLPVAAGAVAKRA